MATKFLDNTGLAHFWSKIKSYIANLLSLKADDSAVVHLAGTEIVTGSKTFSAEMVTSTANTNALRIKSSDYGVLFRNDNSNFLLLVTASGNADGLWTTARPLVINLATGICNINGNAKTTTKLATSRTISLTGDVSGSTSFDGSDNVSITTTVADNSHNHTIDNINDLQTILNTKANDSGVVHLTGTETITGTKTFSSTISGSISGSATSLATNDNPSAHTKMYYTVGQPEIGTTTGKAYKGSSNDATLLSFPDNGTVSNATNANVQNLRMMWTNSTAYFTDIFVSPNNHYIWHRNVVNSVAYGWRRLVEENVSDFTAPDWNINIAGNAATATALVNDSNYVHITGNELITGDKVFTGATAFNNGVDAEISSDNKPSVVIGPRNGTHLEIDNNEIMCKSNYTGVDNLFLNMGGGDTVYLGGNTNDYKPVHRGLNEIISGLKTFTASNSSGGGSAFILKNEAIELGTTPTSSIFYNIIFKDKNNLELGKLEYAQRDSSNLSQNDIKLVCRKKTNDSYVALYLGYDAQGIPYCQAPSTNESRVAGSDIVTRDWIPKDTRIAHTVDTTLYIYISKSGSDSNSGLSANSPVLTFDRAVLIASRYSVYDTISFRVGSGEWGNVTLLCNNLHARFIRVTNWTNSNPSTIADYNALSGDSTPPHFTSLTIYNAYFIPSSIKVDQLGCYTSILLLQHVISFGGIVSKNSYVSIPTPYIVHSANNATDAVFLVTDGYFSHGAIASVFSGTITRTSFVRCDAGACIAINPEASWSGTFSGKKFYSNSAVSIPSTSKSPENFPGTGIDNCALTFGTNLSLHDVIRPTFVLTNATASKDTAPSGSAKYWNINAACGDAVSGSMANSIGYIQFSQETNGSNRISLAAIKPFDSSKVELVQVRYDVNDDNNKYLYCDNKILVNGQEIVSGLSTTHAFALLSQNESQNGGGLWLHGADESNVEGNFRLRAAKNNSYRDLRGTPTGYLFWTGKEYCGDGTNTQFTRFNGGNIHSGGSNLLVTGKSFSGYNGRFDINAVSDSTTTTLRGIPGGTLSWNGQAIQTTSDERKKDFISTIPDDVLDAWESIKWVQFKYKADINEKGEENCRWHSGIVAQHVEKACINAGIDILSYGILCHDQSFIDVESDEREDLWMARYEEALCMEAAYQRRKNKILENRISELEIQVQNMLQVFESLKGA